MRILPVLDLMSGQVVRGIAGRREEYRPLRSLLTDGSSPLEIARAIRSQFGISELYVADLDAILHGRPHHAVLRSLADDGFATLVDAGVRRADDAGPIFDCGARHVVAGLETLAGPAELRRLIERFGSERIVFSLDLRDGGPLGNRADWPDADAGELARRAVDCGCTQLIVLDLAGVGTARGVPTLELCRQIRRTFPHVQIITGGGVRDRKDLLQLSEAAVDAALVASALHNGALTPDQLPI